jgi:hypothetical protein
MEPVETIEDIEENLRQLEAYLASADPEDRDFARSLVRRGLCFVVAQRDQGPLFGPSRFVGYRHNSRAAHTANEEKDGKETNPAITTLLGEDRAEDPGLDEAYRLFCEQVGVEYRDLADMSIRRRYWSLP